MCELGKRIEARLEKPLKSGFNFDSPEEIWEEMRLVTPAFWGINYERIEKEGGVHWPCPGFDHPGTPYLFEDEFPRGKGKFWMVTPDTISELPDEEYPYNLSTGRVLYHWSGSTMTGRSTLEDVYPEATCEMHPTDADDIGLETGDWIEVQSRRGAISLRVLITGRSPEGTIFIPFHFAEAAANLLTLDRIDPRAKIPDYKNTAVKITKISPPDGLSAEYKKDLLSRGAIKDPIQVH